MAQHSYIPPGKKKDDHGADDAATELIREKVARVYSDAPDTRQEIDEAEAAKRRSKHQQFIHKLNNSGKDLATIQTEWHNYYQKLPDHEKHQVWQEFYESQPRLSTEETASDTPKAAQAMAERKKEVVKPRKQTVEPAKLRDARSKREVQEAVREKVSAGGKLQAKHHLQSLLFGLGVGAIVLVIFLFGFFNEVVIAPFIQPSRHASATPLIVNSSTVTASATPEVIIPKINVQIPVDYNQTTIDESQIENALENGVVHYPTTSRPGQNGNAAYFGHSSNNIFNKGKYKFAFVLLHELQNGDTFYLTYNSKVYAYKVISKAIVNPDQVGVLGPVPGQTATATLITCDPPGTSLHRLIVVGQQISPDPSSNTEASQAPTGATTTTDLPGNGPTLLGRFISTPIGKAVTIVIIAAALFLTIRWVNKPKRALQV